MNIITSTDSPLFYNRLSTILSDLPDINLIGITKDLDEAEDLINKSEVGVFIIAFHNIQKTIFKRLKEIKENNRNLIVIILTGNLEKQYLEQWQDAGADYIFDQAFHFNKVIDVLSAQIYKNLLGSFKSNRITNK
jgi:DNA-binding NarL/FixJ family response regulator